MWPKAFAAMTAGLILAVSVAGCAKPQQRPEPQMSAQEMSTAVARVAALDSGGGETAAVVFDNNALIAIQLNAAQPGGTEGQSLGGTVNNPPGRDLTDAGKGPQNSGTGPGGSVGVSPATPGGGINQGGSASGGSPVRTQAVPNASGDLATESGTNAPTAGPGSMGSAPLDVMHRIANQVKSRLPELSEVRFAYQPADAQRVKEIYQAVAAGTPVEQFQAELSTLFNRAAPAGTYHFDPMHPQPAQNPTAPGPNP